MPFPIPSDLRIHNNRQKELRDETAPQSYSAKVIALHVRDNEPNTEDDRQHNEKDKKKSKIFQPVHTNNELTVTNIRKLLLLNTLA